MVDYLVQGRTINDAYYAAEMRRLRQKKCKKEERKIDQRCFALAGQCVCSHVASCYDCCDFMRIRSPSSSPIFS